MADSTLPGSPLGDDLELGDLLPYVKHAVTAYRKYREVRVRWFLQALDVTRNDLDEGTREQLRDHMESDEGRQLLARYVDSVLRTSSRKAIVALGILYAGNDSFSHEFQQRAAVALDGLEDSHAEAFVQLALLKRALPSDDEPYPICILGPESLTTDTPLGKCVIDPAQLYSAVHDLIQRGMLLPDHSTGRTGGSGWSLIYGISPSTDTFRELLQRAMRYAGDY